MKTENPVPGTKKNSMQKKVYRTRKIGGSIYGRFPASWADALFIIAEETATEVKFRKVRVSEVVLDG